MQLNLEISKKEIFFIILAVIIVVGAVYVFFNYDNLGEAVGSKTEVTDKTVGMAVSNFTTGVDTISDQFKELDRLLGN